MRAVFRRNGSSFLCRAAVPSNLPQPVAEERQSPKKQAPQRTPEPIREIGRIRKGAERIGAKREKAERRSGRARQPDRAKIGIRATDCSAFAGRKFLFRESQHIAAPTCGQSASGTFFRTSTARSSINDEKKRRPPKIFFQRARYMAKQDKKQEVRR